MTTTLTWQNIECPAELAGEYAQMKVIYRQYKEAKEAFERAMNSHARDNGLPESLELKFGYNFGKLSAAVVERSAPKAKASGKVASLASFLAAQDSSGRRA